MACFLPLCWVVIPILPVMAKLGKNGSVIGIKGVRLLFGMVLGVKAVAGRLGVAWAVGFGVLWQALSRQTPIKMLIKANGFGGFGCVFGYIVFGFINIALLPLGENNDQKNND